MTYSIVARDPETGELGVAVQSRAFNTGAIVPWAAPGRGRRGDAVVHRALVRPARPRLAAGREDARGGARRARRRRRRARVPPGRDPRRQRAGRRARGRGLHPGSWLRRGRGVQRAGEHGRQRARLGVDGGVLRALGRPAGQSPDRRARRCRGCGRRLARPPGRRDHRRRGRRRAVGARARCARRRPRRSARRAAPAGSPAPGLRRHAGAARARRGRSRSAARARPDPGADLRPDGDRPVAEARELLQPLLEAEPRWADFVRTLADRGLLPHAAELLED